MTIEKLTSRITTHLTELGVPFTIKKDQTMPCGTTYPVAIHLGNSLEDLLSVGADPYSRWDIIPSDDEEGSAWADWYSSYTLVIGD